MEKIQREVYEDRVLVTKTNIVYRTAKRGKIPNSYLDHYGPVVKEINKEYYWEF